MCAQLRFFVPGTFRFLHTFVPRSVHIRRLSPPPYAEISCVAKKSSLRVPVAHHLGAIVLIVMPYRSDVNAAKIMNETEVFAMSNPVGNGVRTPP